MHDESFRLFALLLELVLENVLLNSQDASVCYRGLVKRIMRQLSV
jgi:hypothetical protein